MNSIQNLSNVHEETFPLLPQTGTASISKILFGKCVNNTPLPYHDDIWKVIFSKFHFKDLQKCSSVSKEFYKMANEPFFSKEIVYDELCFNPSHWNEFCGEGTISNEEIKKAFKLLPKNINEILKSPCRVFPDKKIMDNHMLVWIPEFICGGKLTINKFEKMIKPKLEIFNNYVDVWDESVEKDGYASITSGWVLMTKEVLPFSFNKSYAEQQEVIADLNQCFQTEYRVPKVGEVIICIVANYLRTEKRLFDKEACSYIRCHEEIDGYHVCVGCFDSSSLKAFPLDAFKMNNIGIAILSPL